MRLPDRLVGVETRSKLDENRLVIGLEGLGVDGGGDVEGLFVLF